MGESLKPGEAQEPARTFNRVNQAEDIGQNGLVLGFLLELDKLYVDSIEVLISLGQELTQKVVHGTQLTLNSPEKGAPDRRSRLIKPP